MGVNRNNSYTTPRTIEGFTTLTGAPVALTGFQETALVYLLLNGSANTTTVANNCRRTTNPRTRKRETLRYLKLLRDMGVLTSFERPYHDGGFIWYVSALGEEIAVHLIHDPKARIGEIDLKRRHRFCPSLSG